GDEAADAPETEHAERLVGELDAAPLGALPAAVAERGVRLRDVPCERQQQAERVLGGRQGVRLGRVGDDDAAARRRVDVDVVDADTGAADHLQVRRRGDHLRGDLRRRPDDQRVVAADDLVERRVEVDVDVELRAQQLDARVGDPLANENLHGQAATGLSNASNARGTAAPRSMSAPSSVSDSSIAARALAMSKTSNQPMWPIRKTLPLRWAWPGASVTPWRSRRWSRSVSASIPSGARIAVTTAELSSSGENSSSPIAFTPARAARPSRTWRSNACSSPSARISPSATSRLRISETAGVNAASSLSCAFLVARQSK